MYRESLRGNSSDPDLLCQYCFLGEWLPRTFPFHTVQRFEFRRYNVWDGLIGLGVRDIGWKVESSLGGVLNSQGTLSGQDDGRGCKIEVYFTRKAWKRSALSTFLHLIASLSAFHGFLSRPDPSRGLRDQFLLFCKPLAISFLPIFPTFKRPPMKIMFKVYASVMISQLPRTQNPPACT